MSRYLLFSFAVPSLITAFCAAFVLVAPHLTQTVYLQMAGLLARVVILGSFLYVAHQTRRMAAFRKSITA